MLEDRNEVGGTVDQPEREKGVTNGDRGCDTPQKVTSAEDEDVLREGRVKLLTSWKELEKGTDNSWEKIMEKDGITVFRHTETSAFCSSAEINCSASKVFQLLAAKEMIPELLATNPDIDRTKSPEKPIATVDNNTEIRCVVSIMVEKKKKKKNGLCRARFYLFLLHIFV